MDGVSLDEADVTAVLDAALARFPDSDADRVGVMGGSYGGFLDRLVDRPSGPLPIGSGRAGIARMAVFWGHLRHRCDVWPHVS